MCNTTPILGPEGGTRRPDVPVLGRCRTWDATGRERDGTRTEVGATRREARSLVEGMKGRRVVPET